ncbi:MAG: redox-sensing transcriptional repressor Rex [Gemmatimonadota bacterium]
MTRLGISDSTVRRLSVYLRLLRDLGRDGQGVVSSRELAERSGTTSAQVRKDLSLFGSFGKRGRGYDVDDLRATLEEILGLGRSWRVALAGVGKIGGALLGYEDLEGRGFEIVAAFDTDPDKIGRSVFGVEVEALDRLEDVVEDREVEMAIIATPPGAAQGVTDRLVEAGVRGLLNFAPVRLEVPSDVAVRSMDVALEMEGLSFALSYGGGEGDR